MIEAMTAPSPVSTQISNLRVAPSTPDDRAAIHDILIRSGVFHQSDAECVDEMFVETWAKRRDDADGGDNYCWLSCWQHEEMIGFACYGTESLTQDTWDLFWICVRPEARGRGAGRALMDEAEAQARKANGRLMVIYTSSALNYAPARRLYESARFVRSAVVPDYYSDGDDLYIYSKRLR